MFKDFFNLPANPFHDKSEPSFLTIGDVVGAFVVAAAITGGAYAIVKHGDDIMERIVPDANSAVVPETGAALLSQPFVHRTLG